MAFNTIGFSEGRLTRHLALFDYLSAQRFQTRIDHGLVIEVFRFALCELQLFNGCLCLSIEGIGFGGRAA